MPHQYQVIVKDTAGVQQALLTDWRSLTFTRRVNAPDTHQLSLDGSLAAVIAEFALDAQVEVWRADPAAGLALYREYEGFHRTDMQEVTETGRAIFTSYGRGYLDLLGRRRIDYKAGSAGADKSGVGETVIKDFVDENAGPNATVANGRITEGATSGLTMQADGAAGASWAGGRAYRNLLEVVQEIGLATGVDFAVVGTGAGTFEFQAAASPGPLGVDRSTAGLVPATGLNAAGNAPVIFALGFGNMGSPRYSLSRTDEVNSVLVLGQGEAAARVVEERLDAVAIADSPWNRRELSRQGSSESTVAGLQAIGDALLEELQARETFSFDVIQVESTVYGRDYFVSDIVTARFRGIERNLQILEVSISVQQGREDIRIRVGNVGGAP